MGYIKIPGQYPTYRGLAGQISYDPNEVMPYRAAFGEQSSGHYFKTQWQAAAWLKSRSNRGRKQSSEDRRCQMLFAEFHPFKDGPELDDDTARKCARAWLKKYQKGGTA